MRGVGSTNVGESLRYCSALGRCGGQRRRPRRPRSACPASMPPARQAAERRGGELRGSAGRNGDDSMADRILIAAGTMTTRANGDALDTGDNDDLEIAGAGPDRHCDHQHRSGTHVMNLNGRPEDHDARPDPPRSRRAWRTTSGGALQAQKDTFENVDIEKSQRALGRGRLRDRRQHLPRRPGLRVDGRGRSTWPSTRTGPRAARC